MANNLLYGNKKEGFAKLDEFYKSLVFQHIMDGDFSRNERDTLLVIFRKTIHFEKWTDRIAVHSLCKSVGICETTLRATLLTLEEKCLVKIKRSRGGKCSCDKKYNSYGLHNYLLELVFRKWEEIKLENGHSIKYEDD